MMKRLFARSSFRHFTLSFKDHSPPQSSLKVTPPLLIFHGLLGSCSNFRVVHRYPEIASNRRVILADLRNHGASPHSPGPMTFDQMAQDVVDLLDKIGEQQCDIMGHSLGGKVAMATALLHCQRIRKLIVADISPITYDESTAGWASAAHVVRSLASLDFSHVKDRAAADALLATHVADANLRQFVLQNLQPPDADSRVWRLRCNVDALAASLPAFAAFPFDARTHAFTRPALFVAGALSAYLTPTHHAAVRSFFPEAQFRMVERAGHWLHAEQPDAFFNIVGSFLNDDKLK